MRIAILALTVLCVTAMAQPPAAPAPPVEKLQLPGKIQEHQQLFEKMGIPKDQAAVLAVVTGGELDPMKLMLAMSVMNKGEMNGDMFGFMMLMNGMGKAGAQQPVWFRDGETMWVLEEGTLYKINFETMELEGKLAYRDNADLEAATLGTLVKMMGGKGGPVGRAQATACMSNLKQLALAFLMYAQDHDEVLPGETWVGDIQPYHKNAQILTCPARPGLAVGYAMNERLLAANRKDVLKPAQTVLLFESHIGGDNPVGNAADVPDVGIHDGMIGVAFVDGHVQMMAPAEVKHLLDQPVFEWGRGHTPAGREPHCERCKGYGTARWRGWRCHAAGRCPFHSCPESANIAPRDHENGEPQVSRPRPSLAAGREAFSLHNEWRHLEMMLEGKRGVIYGIRSPRSIGWTIAHAASEHGAELCLSYRGEREERRALQLAEELGGAMTCPCDVTNDDDIQALYDKLSDEWGVLDFIVHSVAFAPAEEIEAGMLSTSRGGFSLMNEISAHSLAAVTKPAVPLMTNGGSIIAMTYEASKRVVPAYGPMGAAKAALECIVRYIAFELGPKGIRCNAVSPGPISTPAARGIPHFTTLLRGVEETSPMRRTVALEEVANVAVFLLSDLSSAVTAETIHVDCGMHVS